jgi:general L-amino acid transport system permease protein
MAQHTTPPFWRDVRFWRVASQVIFLAAVLGLLYYFFMNMQTKLVQRGLQLNFGFVENPASFAITGSPIPFSPADSYLRAFQVGILNTLKVAVLGIALTTPLGILIGISRLSSNWLVAKMATVYVETIRNTPLLLQLAFWYFAVFGTLPRVADQIVLPGPIFLNNRGLFLVWFDRHPGAALWFGAVLAAIVLGVFLWRFQTRRLVETGARGNPALWSFLMVLVVALGVWFVLPQQPLTLTIPVLEGVRITGGTDLSPEFAALLVGLVIYTSSFIAEIVRSGIQSVSKGQVEAAQSLGLRPAAVMRLVIFPQALRVIIPPLTSQFLNLTKNSSLALATGYRDLFAVSTTIFNQTGRAIEVFVIVMLVYLTFSLITSVIMNLYNRSVRLVER